MAKSQAWYDEDSTAALELYLEQRESEVGKLQSRLADCGIAITRIKKAIEKKKNAEPRTLTVMSTVQPGMSLNLLGVDAFNYEGRAKLVKLTVTEVKD